MGWIPAARLRHAETSFANDERGRNNEQVTPCLVLA